MNKLETRLHNFGNALQRLKEAEMELRQNENQHIKGILRDGVIQRFEFTYELAWKATKAYLEDMGITDKNSPKAVLKEAYAQLLITRENNWLLMLSDRNLTSHVYSEEMAEEITSRITSLYIKEFEQLLSELRS
ncbi:MAG: HI0074 family nucleotidyltransferase substrate-binding subunit [Syntrophomonadales bacterium]|jgi:nucleotidyltransferase substrate binding protein (TIGR01987 family)